MESGSRSPAVGTSDRGLVVRLLQVTALAIFAAGIITAFIGIQTAQHSLFRVGAVLSGLGCFSFYTVLFVARHRLRPGRR